MSLFYVRFKGSFPEKDTAEDGYHGVSPVTAFPPQNSYGNCTLVKVNIMTQLTQMCVVKSNGQKRMSQECDHTSGNLHLNSVSGVK